MGKLEAYGIAIAAFVIISVAAFFMGDFYGTLKERDAAQTKLTQANEAALRNYGDVLQTRSADDSQAHARTVDLLAAINEGIDGVQKKFAGLPNVVMDARGCPSLTDTARLRWNAVELLPTGPIDEPAGSTAGAVSTGAVSPSR
jgi:hypothetical protein